MNRGACARFVLAMVALAALGTVSFAEAQTTLADMEEFVGPFASWRQITCTGSDDTAMLQRELDNLGTPGHSPVLYLRPSTCVITATLRLSYKEGITVLGADPAQVTIRWAGPGGGHMININGVAYSRFGRITWDGGGRAGAVYRLQWDGKNPFFPTGNRHEDEVFQNAQFGIRAGNEGAGGEAETTVMRSTFRNLTRAGINLEDFNSLDWWVWSSRFENTNTAVTNNYFGGAGNFHVYNSVFVNNAAGDLTFTNTGLFSARGNWSSGSRHFLYGGPIGSAPALVTLQANYVQETTAEPIVMYQPGPLVLVDNTLRTADRVPLVMREAYTDQPTGDVAAIGNKFTALQPFRGVAGRVRGVDNASGALLIPEPAPVLPLTPRPAGRLTFEVRNGDVQAAIDAAVASRTPRPIVHIPYGTYAISRTLTVPANADVQIVGDGLGRTVLRSAAADRVLWLKGPSRVLVRDLTIDGDSRAEGLRVDSADQPGALFQAQELNVNGSRTGLWAAGLRQTDAELRSFMAAGMQGAAVRTRYGSRVKIFGGAGANNRTGFELGESSTLTITDFWYDRGTTQHVAAGGSGTLTWDGGRLAGGDTSVLDVSTFSGSVNLINQLATSPVKGGARTLALGLVASAGRWSADVPPWALWSNRTFLDGGGSRQAVEQNPGVSDDAAYLRDHLAELRATRTANSYSRPPGITDVRLYRVALTRATLALAVTGWATQP